MRLQSRLIPASILAAIPAFSVPLSGADAKAKPGKWQVLFDGKSVEKWRGYKMNSFPDHSWKVEAGAIKTIAGAAGPDIVTKEKFENFELEYGKHSSSPDEPWQPPRWYPFSVVAARTDGARRLRRFRVAQTRRPFGEATSQEIAYSGAA